MLDGFNGDDEKWGKVYNYEYKINTVLQEIAERILHLKQLNDGHYIFPDSYSDLGKIWYDINMKKLRQIIDSIDQNLINNGFNSMQVRNFTKQQGHITIFECIREVLENRGEGLYAYFENLYNETHFTN